MTTSNAPTSHATEPRPLKRFSGEWETKRLSDMGKFISGSVFPLLFQGENTGKFPFFKVSDLNNKGNETFMFRSNNWIDEDVREIVGAAVIPAGSIIFAKIGAAIFLERKRILSRDSCIDNNLMAFNLIDERNDKAFFYYNLCNIRLGQLVSTTALPALSGQHIGAIQIRVPSYTEQRAIAAVLSDIDSMLDALDALIAKKQAVKKATMQQLLTGKTRLPGFSGEWETKRLGDTLTFLTTASNPHSDLGENGEVCYIHYGDVHAHSQPVLDCVQSNLPRIDRKLVERIAPVQDGDLVMVDASEDLEGVGKSVEIQSTQDKTIVAGLHTILCRGSSEFWATGFKAYLQFMPAFKFALTRMATGISVYAISKSQLAEVTLPLPEKSEQAAIAAVLSDMDAEIAALQERRDKTDTLKQGMMQELLTGRIRLPAVE